MFHIGKNGFIRQLTGRLGYRVLVELIKIETAGQRPPDDLAQGIDIVIGDPAEKGNHVLRKQGFRIQNIQDGFQFGRGGCHCRAQYIAGDTARTERHQNPAARNGRREKVGRRQVGEGSPHRQGNGNVKMCRW